MLVDGSNHRGFAALLGLAVCVFTALAPADESPPPTPPTIPAAQPIDANAPLHSQVDAWIGRRLSERSIVPAGASSDAEFLRRVSLDLTGLPPTPQRVREFLDRTAPDKRRVLVDELLASREYATHLARVFDVMLTERRIPTITSYDVPAAKWRAYLTEAFAENRRWNQLAREILSSDGTGEKNDAAVKFFLVRDVGPHQLTRDVGRLFLGIDLQCAQCHDDPRFDAYRQADYFGLYAFLQRVTAFRDNEKNRSLVGETAVGKTTFVSVFTAKNGETQPRLPGGEMVPDLEVDKDKEYVVKPGPKERGVPAYSRRLKLAELLPRAETQGFARNIVNRMWAMLMGRGLVHPLDLHHPQNVPSHPELLACLESWFVAHDYDIQGLLRELVLSETYQRSSVLPEGSHELPDDAYAVAPLRGLTPEQLSWSVLRVTGRIEAHERQLELRREKEGTKPDASVPGWQERLKSWDPLERQAQPLIAVFAGLPGQPDGEFQPVVDQALFLRNSPTMLPLIRDAPGTLLQRLSALESAAAVADELYVSVLSRRPTADETAQVVELLGSEPKAETRRELLTALAWGLLLSAEFRLNH